MKIKLTVFALLALFSLSVINAQITLPTTAVPANNAVDVSLSPTFTWDGAVLYTIQVSTDPAFGTINFTSTIPVASGYVLAGPLVNNTTYYWRALEGTGYNTFSTLLATPVLTAPLTSATCVNTLTPSFTFTYAGPTTGVTFDLQYDAGGVLPGTTVTGVTSGYSGTTFTTNTNYTYRIVAKKTGFTSQNSSSSTFQTTFITSPAHLATSVSICPNFTWSDPSGASGANYTLTVDDNDDFLSPLFTEAGIAVTNYQTTLAQKLDNGIVYYWRVVGTGGSVTTAVGKFSTTAPAVPYLVSPSHLSSITGTIINFQWAALGSSYKYKLQIDNDSNFGSLEAVSPANFTPLNYFTLSYSLATLGSGSYYWRVLSYTTSGELVSISPAWIFTIPGPPNAIPAYPINSQTVYSTSPTIYWYLNNYFYNSAIYYRVRYTTSSGLDLSVLTNGTASASTNGQYFSLSDLTVGATYYYVVDASTSSSFTAGATTTTSAPATFNVFFSSTTLDAVPVFLSYPIAGTTVYSTSPTLYWFLSMQVPGITFDIDYAPYPGAFGAVDYTGVSGNEQALTGLTAGSTYQWRVRINGATTWYGPEIFTVSSSTTTASANIPTLTSPISGTVISTQNPTLSWAANSSEALDYQVIWSSNPALNIVAPFGLANVTVPNGGTSSWLVTTSYVLNNLTPGVTYYWQVRSRLSATPATMSNYSSVGQFTVAAGASPVVVLPANPIVGSAINTTAANLSWVVPAKSSSALTYNLEISKNTAFTGATVINDLNQPSYQANNLDANTVYYWRVKSKTSTGVLSSYSYNGKFSTGSTTAVEQNTIPTEFNLAQNYPNPFNPTTAISYQLTTNSFVTLKIYDMLGREVKTLVSQQMVAGNHNSNWNGDDNYGNKVSSGTYIYRITAGNFVSTKKMVLIK